MRIGSLIWIQNFLTSTRIWC